jgi:hypothetical protein
VSEPVLQPFQSGDRFKNFREKFFKIILDKYYCLSIV